MSSGASLGPVDARQTSGKGGNLRATKCPRPGRTRHGAPKAAATKRAGAHWPTLAQGRLARRGTSIGGREHHAPRSHRNAICRGDSRDTPAIFGHLQPGCAAAVRPCQPTRSFSLPQKRTRQPGPCVATVRLLAAMRNPDIWFPVRSGQGGTFDVIHASPERDANAVLRARQDGNVFAGRIHFKET
jgi:hypothetical protein